MTSRTRQAVEGWHGALPKSIKRPIVIGGLTLLFAFGGGGYWAATAPLHSAVIAGGTVIATGQNKVIQHLEGGIIDKILVEEGQVVEAGQELVRLDPTAAQANLQRLLNQLWTLRAMEARFRAEREDKDEVEFPQELLSRLDIPLVAEIVAGQRTEFNARREELESELAIFEKRIDALNEEIVGLASQRKSALAQLALIEEEIAGTEELLKQGLAQKTRLLALQRAAASLDGDQGEFAARIARAKQTIAETERQMIHLRKQRLGEAVEQLRRVQSELTDIEEQIKEAVNVVDRIVIRAPVKGVIVKRNVNTPGGVIRPGDELIELLPLEENLLIEARVRPEDIDTVQQGGRASLRLVAYKQRTAPTLDGVVEYVSADRLYDPQMQITYYLARIRVDRDQVSDLEGIELSPGMPVEVFIQTGERTPLDYMLRPIFDSMTRAFKEE